MKLKPIISMSILLLVLIACTPSPAVVVTPNPAYHLPQLKAPSGAYMEALFVGYLVAREGCLRASVDGLEEGYLIIWQPGHVLNDNNGVIDILDADGEAVARVGEVVGLSGGEQPRWTGLEGQLREPLPEACAGPYWLMGESVFAFNTVPFTELVANPGQYSGRNVCTTGVYASGFEVNALAASTYQDGDAVYLSEPAVWLEAGSVLSLGDCFASTPVVKFCEATVCGAFQHGVGYGHLGGYEYQILSAVPPTIAEAAATRLASPPAANIAAPSPSLSTTPESVPGSGASVYREHRLCFAVDVPPGWRVDGAPGGFAEFAPETDPPAYNVANVSLEAPLTLEQLLDEVNRGPRGPFIGEVREYVVDGQPAWWVAFAPGAQFQFVVGVIAPDCGDGQHALAVSAGQADRESFETFLSRLRFAPMKK